jgi:hypothetical protein
VGKKLDRKRRKTVSPESIAARKAGLVMTLTRRDALVRQLDTAIRMWFLEQDPVSINLLVMPAYQVLSDLGNKSEKGPKIHKIVGKNFGTGYDWLRHASSDPHDFVDFPPIVNQFLLWADTISFEAIFGGRTAYMMTFQAYFVLRVAPAFNPKFLEGADAFMPDGLTVEQASAFERLDFFTKLTEMFAAQIRRAAKTAST